MSRSQLATALLMLLAPLSAPNVAQAADPAANPAATPAPYTLPQPAAHRALYDLQLESARGGETSAARGSMAYDVTDACDGWATRQRLAMTITNHDGQDIETVSDYVTWESKDGLAMRFRMKQTTEGAVTEQVEGDAKLDGPGQAGTIHYTMPTDTQMKLPAGTIFPMMHTERLLQAAVDGKKFVAIPIFDGTGDKGAQDSSVSIIKWDPKGSPAPDPSLATLPSGQFRIAFFDRNKPGAKDRPDSTPDYEVSMKYWANGVADDLHMDFSDFVMHGVMKEFALQPPHC